jgi:hypothetical protein
MIRLEATLNGVPDRAPWIMIKGFFWPVRFSRNFFIAANPEDLEAQEGHHDHGQL